MLAFILSALAVPPGTATAPPQQYAGRYGSAYGYYPTLDSLAASSITASSTTAASGILDISLFTTSTK